jgi:hypothetical protein
MRLNQSKFATVIGCSQQNISKLIKKGVIKKEEDKKIDVDKAKQSLKDFGLLGKDGKLKKSKTPKKEESEDRNFHQTTSSLPLNSKVAYDSYAYLSNEEIEKKYEEKAEKYKELTNNNKHVNQNLDDSKKETYSEGKARRENALASIAEIDLAIKLEEYVLKTEVKATYFEASRTTRDRMLSMESKLGSRGLKKNEVKIVMEEVNLALGELSNE